MYTKQVIYILLLNEHIVTIKAMLGSYRLLLLTKLILFELLGLSKSFFSFELSHKNKITLVCIENNSFHRLLTSISHNNNSSINPLIIFVSVDDYFAVINCSTPDRVPHHKLDWYFQTRASIKPPRVIWQRGRSNIHRYIAYSPDQFRHFLQIKPLHSNDSGTYMCLDQTTGFYTRIELLVRKFYSIIQLTNI